MGFAKTRTSGTNKNFLANFLKNDDLQNDPTQTDHLNQIAEIP